MLEYLHFSYPKGDLEVDFQVRVADKYWTDSNIDQVT